MNAQPPYETGPRECDAPECASPRRSTGAQWCEKHYYRMRRNGTLEAAPKRSQRGLCAIEGCGQLDTGAHGLCSKHHTRVIRHGSPHTVKKTGVKTVEDHPKYKGDNVGYRGAHERVRALRGSASTHSCIDCGTQASHWSYNHNGRHENIRDGLTYGVDVTDYEPRCIPCHKRFDLEHIETKRTRQESVS